jgi:hypothetical protein
VNRRLIDLVMEIISKFYLFIINQVLNKVFFSQLSPVSKLLFNLNFVAQKLVFIPGPFVSIGI